MTSVWTHFTKAEKKYRFNEQFKHELHLKSSNKKHSESAKEFYRNQFSYGES